MSDRLKTWLLVDAEESHRCAPATFRVPNDEEKRRLGPGKVVQLHFTSKAPKDHAPQAERMWVRINLAAGSKLYGELLDEPISIANLSRGDKIEFEKRHVASILITKDDPDWIDETKYALVSKRVLEDGELVRFLYREGPDEDADSGWRIFSGDEDEDYVENPDNFRTCPIEKILNMDESLAEVLKYPAPKAFERETTGHFNESSDFKFGEGA